MTATDKLRRLLDERGVAWGDLSDFGIAATEWRSGDGSPCNALESDERPLSYVPDGKLSVQANLTPEQAIEATLGRGECRNLITRVKGQMPMLHCEECGCTTTLNVPSGGAGYAGETEMRWPRFCSNCGRKVVDA